MATNDKLRSKNESEDEKMNGQEGLSEKEGAEFMPDEKEEGEGDGEQINPGMDEEGREE